MEIKKTAESVKRSYNDNGEVVERVESTNINLSDTDNQATGRATIYQGSANISIDISGFSSIEEGLDRIKAIFNVEE